MAKTTHPIILFRLSNALSQEDLAKKLKTTQASVSRWEDKKAVPQKKFHKRLERLIGKPIGEIIAACI